MTVKFPKIGKNSIAQDAVNCWLRYTLSQPVDLDLGMVYVFLLRFFGFPQWQLVAHRLANVTGYYRLTIGSLIRPDMLGTLELPEYTMAEIQFPHPTPQ